MGDHDYHGTEIRSEDDSGESNWDLFPVNFQRAIRGVCIAICINFGRNYKILS